MSLDYPLYEEMVRRKSRGRWYWRIGDWLYYIGLLETVVSLPLYVLLSAVKLRKPGMSSAPAVAGTIAALGIGTFMLGGFLKGVSYSIAKKEGIDIQKY